nr:MAG TPA: hypothetical protein [Caudoviricetes sp.]
MCVKKSEISPQHTYTNVSEYMGVYIYFPFLFFSLYTKCTAKAMQLHNICIKCLIINVHFWRLQDAQRLFCGHPGACFWAVLGNFCHPKIIRALHLFYPCNAIA